MIKTKIVATLGPASAASETIGQLIAGGVDIFRLNFSHGTFEDHGAVLARINQQRPRQARSLAVMGDLCGPKIRSGRIEPEGEYLNIGDEVVIQSGIKEGTPRRFGTNYEPFAQDVAVGQRVLIDDGQIRLEVMEIRGEPAREVVCRVATGGPLYSHKGINLPKTRLSTPAITARDWECVDWAIEHGLDFLALSFVRSAEEVNRLKDYLRMKGAPIKVVPKIEKPEAVADIEAIVRAADAVLVARGDLGVEMDLAEVPLIQKRITSLCRREGKPVIVATQMLQSMIEHPGPTRAEVSDVANAIMDFADSVMLSGETAVGLYPLEAVRTIVRIARRTEWFLDESDQLRPVIHTEEGLAVTASLARSVAHMIDELRDQIRLVVTFSQTGATARLLSKSRIDVPIIAFSSEPAVSRQMSLHYGVIAVHCPPQTELPSFIRQAEQLIVTQGWAEPGNRIILLPGGGLTGPTNTHALFVHQIGNATST